MTRDGSRTEADAAAYARATTEPEPEDIDYAPLEGGDYPSIDESIGAIVAAIVGSRSK